MATFSASDVKELRERTGAGMSEQFERYALPGSPAVPSM